MKNAVLWDVAPGIYFVFGRFGVTYRLHLQGIRNSRAMNQREQVAVVHSLKMEAIRSSETSVNKISTWRHIPEDGILQFRAVCGIRLILITNSGCFFKSP
jgi:hypothetical protein